MEMVGSHLWKWKVTFWATNCDETLTLYSKLPNIICNLVGSRLWKRYVTALGNPVKLPKTICNRLWKRYVTARLVTYPVM